MTAPTTTPDAICERLLDEEMRLAGQAIDRGCVDSSLSGILANQAADLIQQQQATIERLSDALVRLRSFFTALDDWLELGQGKFDNQLWFRVKRRRADLGKDASDVRAREEDRG